MKMFLVQLSYRQLSSCHIHMSPYAYLFFFPAANKHRELTVHLLQNLYHSLTGVTVIRYLLHMFYVSPLYMQVFIIYY